MNQPSFKMTRKKEAAIAALLTHGSIKAAAEAVGVGDRSLRRWLRHPAFLSQYRQARAAVVEHAVAQLQGATAQAVQTLQRNLDCGTAAVEVRAAEALVKLSLKGFETWSLIEELDNVKRRLDAYEGRKGGYAA